MKMIKNNELKMKLLVSLLIIIILFSIITINKQLSYKNKYILKDAKIVKETYLNNAKYYIKYVTNNTVYLIESEDKNINKKKNIKIFYNPNKIDDIYIDKDYSIYVSLIILSSFFIFILVNLISIKPKIKFFRYKAKKNKL